MIFLVVGLIILIYGIIRPRRGFMIYLVFRMFLNSNITLISQPGMPTLTLSFFLDLSFVAVYLLYGKRFKNKNRFPFTAAFILIAISWILSSVFSLAGFKAEITRVAVNIVSELVLVFLIWRIIETEKDFNCIFDLITVVILFSTLYGILELILQYNPLANYEAGLMRDAQKAINYTYDINSARGYRIKSIFFHAIGAGMNWGLYLSYFVYALLNDKYRIIKKPIIAITAVLCAICIFLTKSRAPLLFVFITCVGNMNFKKKKSWEVSIIIICVFVFVSPFLIDKLDILFSIFDKGLQKKVGGSNSAMRLDQLEAAYLIMKESPIFGLGIKYQDILKNSPLVSRLKGSESVWFSILPSYGFAGVFMELFLIWKTIFGVRGKYNSKEALFLAVSYWGVYTLTSVPGFLTYLYYLLLFYFLKGSGICNRKYEE